VSDSFQTLDFDFEVQYYFSPILPVVRAFISFTSNVPISISVGVNYFFGSTGGNPVLYSDFSGNLNLNSSDYWAIFGDDLQDDFDRYIGIPIVTLSYYGPGATVQPDISSSISPSYSTYQLDLEPGVTQSLLMFAELNLNPEAAGATTGKYNNADELRRTDLLFGLSSAELDSIVNWNLSTGRKVSSYTGICDFASEIRSRVSKFRSLEKHVFSEPWRC